jgi:LPS-assembly lipoprotein
VGITPEGATTRQQLHGAATFALRDLATGAERLTGRVEGFTAWSTTATAVATLVAEEAAEARLMRILADQVTARLLAWPGAERA